MNIQKKDIICPTCGKENTWNSENKFRPFCSERCKLIDLGDWAAEKHRVSGEPTNASEEKEEDEDK